MINEYLLRWQPYRFFPYEKELGLQELKTLMRPTRIQEIDGQVIRVSSSADLEIAKRLTYFETISDRLRDVSTYQSQLEASSQNGDVSKRQATRYSVHGLHDYKGKFNPQTAHCLINVLGVPEKGTVFDPFCGSGTTLVECVHSNVNAFGTDINPLAVFIANAKVEALRVPLSELTAAVQRIVAPEGKRRFTPSLSDERGMYLAQWFAPEMLRDIELVRNRIDAEANLTIRRVLSVLSSDLLRENSLQEPLDLRIRRRKESPIYRDFKEQLEEYANKVLGKVVRARSIRNPLGKAKAVCHDSSDLGRGPKLPAYDAVISSPPYATALPYIDTQRLSLIWLGLTKPSELGRLQADLIGSREFKNKQRIHTQTELAENVGRLPKELHDWCLDLQHRLGESDGFRRQAMPVLLYRYFASMLRVFEGMKRNMREGSRGAFVVGHNHTTLGGIRIDIDTPAILGTLAKQAGYRSIERMPLQAYQRYGMHQRNAVSKEEMLFFTN